MFCESVKKYGAMTNALCTDAIQATIDACHKSGGGEVTIEDGIYVTGTLFLHSYVTLVIRPNAVLKASTDGEDYPDFSTIGVKKMYLAIRHAV